MEQQLCSGVPSALTVSDTFAAWLKEHWGLRAVTLHDKAPAFFHPVDATAVRLQHVTVSEQCCASCVSTGKWRVADNKYVSSAHAPLHCSHRSSSCFGVPQQMKLGL